MAHSKTMTRNVIAAICLYFLAACTTGEATNDFDVICGYFEELKADSTENSMTPIKRNQIILEKLTKNLAVDSNALIAWQAISNAQANERYELFRSAANASGFDNWQCSAMQELAGKTGEFE